VPPLPDLFAASPLLAAALQRVEAGAQPLAAPTDGLDTARYGLPGPETDDEASWRAAFDNASAQLEHQRLRLGTLDLMGRFGANAWRIDNFLLERNIERVKRELEDVRARTEDVNRRRKASQTEAGERLTELESRWTRLVSQNLQLEIANMCVRSSATALTWLSALENELGELSKREGHLKARIEGLSAQAAA